MTKTDLRTPLRAHAVSAGMGALYSLLLHLAVWVSLSVCHLVIPSNGNHLPKFFVPACIMLVGLIVFIVIKSAAVEPLTFYGVLLLTHILLAVLMAPCIQPLADLLDAVKGITPPLDADLPDGNLNGFYFMLHWVLLTVGMGVLLFVLSVAFYLRDILRRVMGHAPKDKKKD